MYKTAQWYYLLILFLTPFFSIHAKTFDHEYLLERIKQQLKQNIPQPEQGQLSIDVPALDPRITIQDCDSDIDITLPKTLERRNINVKISCQQPKSWQLFVPVKLKYTQAVVITKQAISKGTILSKDNITITYKDSAQIRAGVVTEPSSLYGARSKRYLFKGKIINQQSICLVCKGESVTIIAKSVGLEIKSQGTALVDGNLGEVVTIKNNKSGRLVKGRVNAINQVVINL